MLVYEAGEAARFDDVVIRVGTRGILSVMEEIGMPAKSKRKVKIQSQIADSTIWSRAPIFGIFRTKVYTCCLALVFW